MLRNIFDPSTKETIYIWEFLIKTKNEETLGKLFSYFILETVIIGKLVKLILLINLL